MIFQQTYIESWRMFELPSTKFTKIKNPSYKKVPIHIIKHLPCVSKRVGVNEKVTVELSFRQELFMANFALFSK